MLSGRLREAGIENDILEVVFNEASEHENAELMTRLADQLVSGGYGIIAFRRIWDVEIPEALRRLLADRDHRPLFAFAPKKAFGEKLSAYDAVVRGDAFEAFSALAAGTDLRQTPGISFPVDGELVESEVESRAEGIVERWRHTSNFERIQVNPEVEARPPHVVIYGNPGCPYRRPITAIAFWRGVEVDPAVTNTRGCAFCDVNLGDDYRFVADIADACQRQIAAVQADLPEAYEMILLDQDPFPFLPRLFELLLESEARPLHLLIQARADLFVKRTEHFERALHLARRGGHQLSPFLIGIENFHQPTLEIYNKGVTVETNIAVLEYLDSVAERFDDVYDRDKVSPGFILWHPWVTFESLRVNVESLERFGLVQFRSEVTLSKIRLYPDIPFYWKVKSDGLLIDAYQDRAFSSAIRYGYPEEHPYRFAQPEAQAAYALLAAMCAKHEPIHEVRLLAIILDWVESHREYWDEERLLALREPVELVARFEADRESEVLKLRKTNTSLRRRSLSTSELASFRALVDDGAATEFELALVIADERRTQLFFSEQGMAEKVKRNPRGAAFRLILEPRSEAPHYVQSARYNISYSASDDAGDRIPNEIRRLCARIRERDSGRASV